MTRDDFAAFGEAYTRMARALGAKAVTTDAISAAYGDCEPWELAVVEDALDVLRRTSRFLPRPVQLLEACRDADRRAAMRRSQAVAGVQEGGYCAACGDTGFTEHRCEGPTWCARCHERGHRLYPHGFARICACRPTNPVLAQQRALALRHADKGAA